MITSLSSLAVNLLAMAILLLGVAARADARVIRVMADAGGIETGDSWDDAYSDLQDALAAAVEGDEIWVAAGTYKPTKGSDRGSSFVMRSGVGVYGGFLGREVVRDVRDWKANKTILSGEIGDPSSVDDNSHSIVRGAAKAVLDGFTITHGNSYWTGTDERNVGSAMTLDVDPVTVANCTFFGCATRTGQAIVSIKTCGPDIINCDFMDGELHDLYMLHSAPRLFACTFIGRSSYGNIFGEYSSPTLTGCEFSSSSLWLQHGAITLLDCSLTSGMLRADYCSTVTVLRSSFTNNHYAGSGGAILLWDISRFIVDACVFDGNHAKFGGGAIDASYTTGTITNSVFCRNRAGSGGAVRAHYSNLAFNNCVLTSNTAIDYGGAFLSGFSNISLNNCVFWNNKALYGEVYDYHRTDLAFLNCILAGSGGSGDGWVGWMGIDAGGNMDCDPLFIDPLTPAGPDGLWRTDDDGFRLRLDSPCIDAGFGWHAPLRDILGLVRTGRPDIGAYEFGARRNSASEWLTYP